MPEPLNPGLYNALRRRFGHVTIANEGEEYIPYQTRSHYRPGRVDSPPAYAGEYYRVSCPFCDDTRQRLWINHMFYLIGDDGDDHLYLAICYNEGCIDTRQQQKRLLDMIYPFGYRARQRASEVLPAKSDDSRDPKALPPPEQSVQLPPSCPFSSSEAARARDYLNHRGFDPCEISSLWDVTYCLISPFSSPEVFDRIVIPVHTFRRGLLFRPNPDENVYIAGWQAREVCDRPNSPCRYLSMKGMRKNQLLYGLPRAVHGTGPLVVVEGPTDVWRLRDNAVATFGKSVSPAQIALMIQYFAGRPIIVMFDRDAVSESHRSAQLIRQKRISWNDNAPVLCLEPPAGMKDVGDCLRDLAWKSINASLGT